MKTKNILFPAIALAIFAAPVLAQNNNHPQTVKGDYSAIFFQYQQQPQDYHEYEDGLYHMLRAPVEASQRQHQNKYLDTVFLRECMSHDFYDAQDLLMRARNSIRDNKISIMEQYDLMVDAIKTNSNELLEVLLQAGFNPEIDAVIKEEQGIEVTPLKDIAISLKNMDAFDVLKIYTPKKMLKKITPRHVNRPNNSSQIPGHIKLATQIAAVTSAAPIKIGGTLGVPFIKNSPTMPLIHQVPAATMPGERVEATPAQPKEDLNKADEHESDTSFKIMPLPNYHFKSAPASRPLLKEGYKVDTIPAAEITIPVTE